MTEEIFKWIISGESTAIVGMGVYIVHLQKKIITLSGAYSKNLSQKDDEIKILLLNSTKAIGDVNNAIINNNRIMEIVLKTITK